MQPNLESLWARLAAGEVLSAGELGELEQAISADESVRVEMLADDRMSRVLGAWQRTADEDGTFMQRVVERVAVERDARRFVGDVQTRIARTAPSQQEARDRLTRRRTRWPVVAGVAAGAAMAIAAMVVFRPGGPAQPGQFATATAPTGASVASQSQDNPAAPVLQTAALAHVSEAQGSIYLVEGGRKVRVGNGAAVRGGQGVMTLGRDAVVRLAFSDGSEAELGADSYLSSVATSPVATSPVAAGGGVALFLFRGSLRADVSPRALQAPFVVATPHAEVQALGSRLALSVTADATKLRVDSGRVHVIRNAGDALDVRGGQQALVEDKGKLAARALPPGGLAILVAGAVDLDPGDTAIKSRLEQLGFEVRIRYHGSPIEKEAKYADLFVVSSTIEAPMARRELRDVPVPLLCWEGSFLSDLGMAATNDQSIEIGARGELSMRTPGHPLAAGLSGSVRVLREPANMHWARPGPLAVWIAEMIPVAGAGSVPRVAIFGYERNTPMVGMVAPARRVGFFLDDETPVSLNENGWALFDAAVQWLTQR